MSLGRRVSVVAAVFVTAGLAFWLATRRPGGAGDRATPDETSTVAPPAALAMRGASRETTPRTDAAPDGVRISPIDPALAGVGSLRLRVVRSDGDRVVPVEGASVVLHGTGHGYETIRLAARSGPDGVARFSSAAAAWLTLDVAAAGEPSVVRADVDVARDRETDLGDVRVGVRRTLRVPVIDEASRPA